jgi:hypothetical protein
MRRGLVVPWRHAARSCLSPFVLTRAARVRRSSSASRGCGRGCRRPPGSRRDHSRDGPCASQPCDATHATSASELPRGGRGVRGSGQKLPGDTRFPVRVATTRPLSSHAGPSATQVARFGGVRRSPRGETGLPIDGRRSPRETGSTHRGIRAPARSKHPTCVDPIAVVTGDSDASVKFRR